MNIVSAERHSSPNLSPISIKSSWCSQAHSNYTIWDFQISTCALWAATWLADALANHEWHFPVIILCVHLPDCYSHLLREHRWTNDPFETVIWTVKRIRHTCSPREVCAWGLQWNSWDTKSIVAFPAHSSLDQLWLNFFRQLLPEIVKALLPVKAIQVGKHKPKNHHIAHTHTFTKRK